MVFSTVDYLASRGIHPDGRRMKEGRDWYYTCLFHAPDHDPSLRVNSVTGLWMCPVCNRKGNLETMILALAYKDQYTPMTWRLIQDYIRHQHRGSETPRPIIVSPGERGRSMAQYADERQQDMLKYMMQWWHSCLHRANEEARDARTYLTKEVGAPLASLDLVQVGYAPMDRDNLLLVAIEGQLRKRYGSTWQETATALGLVSVIKGRLRFRNRFRITFSCVHPQTRAVLYYQARWASSDRSLLTWANGKPRVLKYLNPPGTIASFPFSLPIEEAQRRITGTIGVESPKGPLVLSGYGIPAVATLGSGMNWNLLHLWNEPFFWMQDNDAPHDRFVNGEKEVYYPGEYQAQVALEACQERGLTAFRARPPASTKDVDTWMRETQSIYPLLRLLEASMHTQGVEDEHTIVDVFCLESDLQAMF